MTLVNPKLRSISVQTVSILKPGQDPRTFNWQTNSQLSFEVYEGSNAWYGRLPRREHREDWPYDGVQEDLSKFDELVKLLRPIPKDKLYPEFAAEELTQYKPRPGDKPPYFKAPKLDHYKDGSNDLAIRLLAEAKIYERISCSPHPNLGRYLGCVVEEGRIVRLALQQYTKSLYERLQLAPIEEFDTQQRQDCMDQIEAAATHLHSLGLAHNDISPSNIVFDTTGQAVLIDFDCCAPLGNDLTKGGLVTGWRGPIAGEGLQFKQSSVTCDKSAIQEIRNHLATLSV